MTKAAQIAELVSHGLGCEPSRRGAATYVAVSRNGEPRWLLPSRETAIANVLSGWSPYRPWAKVAWSAVRAANRMYCLEALLGTESVRVGEPSGIDWKRLGWTGISDPIAAIYVGTESSHRKAVVHLVERKSGQCRAIVKVPLTHAARTGLLHEAATLLRLEREHFVFAPRVLHIDWESGLTTQSYVEGRSGPRRPVAEVEELLRSLRLRGEVSHLQEFIEHWYWQSPTHVKSGTVANVLEELADCDPLPAYWEHGDFTPWNVRATEHGPFALVDWESAGRPGLPLVDLFHFLHAQDFLFGAPPRTYWRQAVAFAQTIGLGVRQTRQLEMAYAVRTHLQETAASNQARAMHASGVLTRLQRKDV